MAASLPRAGPLFAGRADRQQIRNYPTSKNKMDARDNYVSFLSGLIAGVAQAGLFNPYDRALYLSVKHRRPFLSKENFHGSYQGFLQSMGGRALAGGLYFPLEHFFHSLVPKDGGAFHNFLAGTGAGAFNALMLNPMSAVKYKTWGRDVSRGMIGEVRSMYRKGGVRPFFNGMVPTLWRDVVFGGCYTLLRLQAHEMGLPQDHQWCANFAAAAVATVASGPFNLARNVQFSTKSRLDAPTIVTILCNLATEVSLKSEFRDKASHLQKRLRIGWGTARVAFGMAFGNQVYDLCMAHLAESS